MIEAESILITGASSGLGAELARCYAAPGKTLYLTARHQARLEHVVSDCRHKGASVYYQTFDVKIQTPLTAWILSCDAIKPIDLVIANAGISAGTGGDGEPLEQVSNILHTNIDGVTHTIYPAMQQMIQRRRGQIALVSSLAGLRGLPSSPAYAASKAAVKVYGEGLRGYLQQFNVGVTVIIPGYIRTPMTDINHFPMPGLMDADKAALLIKRKLRHNPARIAFPLGWYMVVRLVSILPPWVTDYVFSRLPSKPNEKQQKSGDTL